MRIEISELGQIESFYQGMTEPEQGAFSYQDEVIESSWCPLCGEGEDHKNIKICNECQTNK